MSSSSSPGTAPAAWAAGLLRVRWVVRAPVGLYRADLTAEPATQRLQAAPGTL